MNILFLINYAGNAGTEKYVDNLQKIFTENGDNCFLAYNVEGQLSHDLKKRGIPVFRLDLTSACVKHSAKLLGNYCREHAIDVIHAQFPVENIIAVNSLKYFAAPKVVFTSHLSDRQGLKWNILNRINTPKDHRVICVCDEGKENLVASGIKAGKIDVIYNGVEPSDEKHVFSDDGCFRLLIMARYSREKGLDFLLDVLDKLKEKTSMPFSCTILGEGELLDEIKLSAKEKELEENLVFAGFTRDTKSYLDKSDLYLNTSRSGEAMSFAILEAMNNGLPVVATDVGGNKKLTDNIYEFNDADGFAECILSYMNDREKLKADSLMVQEKIKAQFDLKKLAMDVRKAYL